MTDSQHIAADYVAALDDAEFQAWAAAARDPNHPMPTASTPRRTPAPTEQPAQPEE